ncbi:hypothetical protein BV22DRAFT_1135187 [Leucogyrophana mollusca]|uniref:Uncharacterized protein n=1 Tax=Leucogyrophana mollusca TaxID=85980 RepID=A0ACB8AVZ4_9AGAM|nr:hypothetical protein BV22DRAFT_1135187 [Leucogyrophana mollusca]
MNTPSPSRPHEHHLIKADRPSARNHSESTTTPARPRPELDKMVDAEVLEFLQSAVPSLEHYQEDFVKTGLTRGAYLKTAAGWCYPRRNKFLIREFGEKMSLAELHGLLLAFQLLEES